jgi:transcriptional regulator with XRE-family HTH domain
MDHAQAPPRREDIPVVPVTADQLVAYNLRHWRRAAGMTQEEAAARLGWKAGNLSAVELSWNADKDRRRFDAQTLTEMALALGVPVAAFFLPPPGDGTDARYLLDASSRHYDMGDLMALVVMPDNDDETPVMTAYRERFNADAARYLDPEWAAVAGRLLGDGASPEARADMAARLADQQTALLAAAGLLGDLAAALGRQDGDR